MPFNTGFYTFTDINLTSLTGIDQFDIIGNPNGTFTAVYTVANGIGTDTSGTGLIVRVYDIFGNSLIPEGQANTFRTFGNQFDPDLASLSDGGAALVYSSGNSFNTDIFYERRDAAGVIVSSGTIANSGSREGEAAISDFGGGRLLTTYVTTSGGASEINARIVQANGSVSSEILIDDAAVSDTETSVDLLEDGRAVIGWVDQIGGPGSGEAVSVYLLNASGFGGTTIQLTDATTEVSDVDVAALTNGNFVVAWTAGAGNAREVRYSVLAPDGTMLIDEETLNIFRERAFNPDVDALPDGGFTIAYTDQGRFVPSLDPATSGGLRSFDADGSLRDGSGRGRQGIIDTVSQGVVSSDGRAISFGTRDAGQFGDIEIDVDNFDDGRRLVEGSAQGETILGNNFSFSDFDRVTINANGGADTILLAEGGAIIDGGSGFDTLDYSFFDARISIGSQGEVERVNRFGDDVTDTLLPDGGAFSPSVERIVADTETANGTAIRTNTIDGENSIDSRFDINLNRESVEITLLNVPGRPDIVFEVANFQNVIGTGRPDRIIGDNNNNRLEGNNGADVLAGAAGVDRLFGGGSNDRLIGGSGNDILVAGTGDDRLTGNSGSDRFVLENRPGSNVITDFAAGVDKIDASRFTSIDDFDVFVDTLVFEDAAGNSYISDDGSFSADTIYELSGVAKADLSEGDFLF